MLNSLTLLWKALLTLFHWCRRLDREKISHLPEGMRWLSIRDQIKPWHYLALSSMLQRFCLLKKLLKEELKHIVPTLNMPPTHPSVFKYSHVSTIIQISLSMKTHLPSPLSFHLISLTYPLACIAIHLVIHLTFMWAKTQPEVFSQEGNSWTCRMGIFLNQAKTCMSILNMVSENVTFSFHSALLRNNTTKGRQRKKKIRFVLQKEHVKWQY